VAKAFHHNMTADPLDLLSVRERDVLQMVVEGNSTAEIARSLSLSPKSVETYRSRIKQKLSLRTLPDLVKFAIRHGLTTLD
jgi:DNA-binding CsgD family transcriptional regulator